MITEASIIAIANTIRVIFEYMLTPEGQAQAKEWREDRAKMKADWAAMTGWFSGLLEKK